MTETLCTCGKRPKHKCCEESEHKSGKMCLKGHDAQPINLKGLSETTENRMSNVDKELKKLREELRVELLPKYLTPEQQKRLLKAYVEDLKDEE